MHVHRLYGRQVSTCGCKSTAYAAVFTDCTCTLITNDLLAALANQPMYLCHALRILIFGDHVGQP